MSLTREAGPTKLSPAERLAGQTQRARSEWRRPLLLSLVLVVVLRVVLGLWAAYVLANFPTTDLARQYAHVGFPLQGGAIAGPWEREDALWYEKIATVGYDPNDGSTAFLPLFPLVMRAASLVTLGDIALAGILVSSLAAVAALALLYRLSTLDGDGETGLRSVLYLALFPTAFFLLSAFTESLFLALAIGAFWQARHGRWWLVVPLAALAGLAKVQGALLCVPLGVEYLHQTGWNIGKLRSNILQVAAVVLSGPLASAAFFAFTRYMIGDRISWSERVTALWHFKSTWPGETLATAVGKIVGEGQFTINAFDLLVLVGFLVLTAGAFRLRPSYGLQPLTALVPSLLRVNADFPLMSLSRYALVAFPCFIVLAMWTQRRPRMVHLLVLALWASLLLVWSSQSVRGFWVG